MTARTQLIDLPDEMLCEILTYVPYEHIRWPKLHYVNRRFMRIMSEDLFERKVAAIQFYNLYHLLPDSYTKPNLLYSCKEFQDHVENSMQSLSHITGQARDLVELGSILACLIPMRIKCAVLEFAAQKDYEVSDPRVEVYLLRLLRLLPSDVARLLRYSALKSYETRFPGSVASVLNANPQGDEYVSEVLTEVESFLNFEYLYTHVDMPLYSGSVQLMEGLVKQALLIEQTGKYLPSMVMITRACTDLSYTSYAYVTTTHNKLFGPWPYNFHEEATQQLILTKKLCEDLEAEDGKKIGQILIELDPKILRPIMVEQEQFIADLNSLDELYECLCDEIKLLLA